MGCKIEGDSAQPGSRAAVRRSRLIEAARALFAENGFHGTGVAQLAKQSGVLVGQIYRDFENKEGIVAAIVEQDIEDFLIGSELCAAIEQNDPCLMRHWIRHFVKGRDVADRRLIAEIIAESARNERISNIFLSIDAQLRGHLCHALDVIAPGNGKAEQRKLIADMILTIAAGVFQRRVANNGDIDEILTDALCIWIDGLIDDLISNKEGK